MNSKKDLFLWLQYNTTSIFKSRANEYRFIFKTPNVWIYFDDTGELYKVVYIKEKIAFYGVSNNYKITTIK